MDAAAKLKSKYLHKIVLLLIKVLPIIIAATYLLNTILSYFYIDVPLLSYISGNSILFIILLYLTSIAFQFCRYHRMFIHYITLNWILNIVDYYIGIPLSNRSLFLMYIIITGIFLFIILYEHCKQRNIKIIKRSSR